MHQIGKKISYRNLEKYKDNYRVLLNELLAAEYEIGNLKQILNASSDAILITTPDAKIIYANPAWENLTGYSLTEVEGKTPKFLKSGKTPPQYYKKLWKNLKNNQSFTNEELIDKRKDGTEFPAHATTFPVMRFNSILYYVQFLYDITDRLEQEKQKQEVLSFVSHELKTPITVLKLIVSKYLNSQKNQPKQIDWENMDKELDRLTELIDESLDVSRIELNKLNLQLDQFDLNTLIEEVIEQISLTAGLHKIFFSTHPDLKVVADYKRIKQVVINLLTNAIKFSPENRKVEVYASIKGNHIVVSIKDYGIGIPKEEHTLIFEKSYQVQKRTSEGLGLGLFISKEIIKKHHGKIWVTSKKGQGSIFSFTLPFKKKTG